MLVTLKRTKHLHNLLTYITIGDAKIPFKPSVKNLGFTLDCYLTVNTCLYHCSAIYYELCRWQTLYSSLLDASQSTIDNLERWAEYTQNLLNKNHATEPAFLDDLPTLSNIPKLDDPPSFDEVENAILSIKDNKSAGPHNIPPEAIKHGGCALHRRLHNFIHDCWSAKCHPQQWKMATLFMYTNRRVTEQNVATVMASPFSLWLAKIMLTFILENVVDLVLPESQCGIQCGCSTIDMTFVAWQLQEKCHEWYQDLYMAFADVTMAFVTVNRDLLWGILCKLGYLLSFIATLQQFHTGMCAQVVMAASQSSSFPVVLGVKQGCVLVPISPNCS